MEALAIGFKFSVPLRAISYANTRMHWAAKAKVVSRDKLITKMAWLEAGAPKIPVPGVVMLVRVAPRRLDDDNLRGALKAVRDQIAELAGVNDAKTELVRYEYDQAKDPRPNHYRVDVIVWSAA